MELNIIESLNSKKIYKYLLLIFIILLANYYVKSIIIPGAFTQPIALLFYLFIALIFSYIKPIEALILYISLGLNMGVIFDIEAFHLPGLFKFRDIMFLMTFSPLISPQIKKYPLSSEVKKILLFFLLFSLYFIFITHYLSYSNDLKQWLKSLIYYRAIHYWVSIVPVYIILSNKRNLEEATILMLKISFFISILALAQFLFPQIRISKVIYQFEDIYATGQSNLAFIIPSLGYIYLFMLVGLGFFLRKKSYQNLGLYSFIFISVVLVLWSGRTTFARMIFYTLFYIFILRKLNLINKFNRVFKFLLIIFIFILIDNFLNIFNIISYLKVLIHSGIYESTEIKGTFGYRFLIEFPQIWPLILKNPLFGNGIISEFSTRFNIGYSAIDLGFFGIITSFGLIGSMIILMPYIKIFQYSILEMKKGVKKKFKIEHILLFSIFSFYCGMVFFIWNFNGNVFSSEMGMYLFGIYLAIFFVSLNKLKEE